MRIRASKSSFSSSIHSSNSNPSVLPPSDSPDSDAIASRCEGLDLLVLAVIEVFGDRAMEVEKIGSSGVGGEDGKQETIEKRKEEPDDGAGAGPTRKRRKRQLATPSRFQDSVMQPWERRKQRRPGGLKRSG